ncbi:hypothetical protein [Sporichthya sp.]|uniref:hypothetical protein n=1 Tax=Sporichthya sp. TaxID=65475 RepID=UPI0017906F80|nr:hypothetical protein [Sporichthya sp.]MBA3745648.1 hypothetical protein [Sporichthya sp.]
MLTPEIVLHSSRYAERWDKFTDRLAGFNIEISLAGVVKVTGQPQAATESTVVTQDMLRALVIDATEQLTEAGRAGLMLTFDELQEAPVEDLRVLVNVLQELTVSGHPVVTVAAGLPALPERLMEAGSFAERFAFRRMHNLTPQAAMTALLTPAQRLGVRWAEDSAEAVVMLCGGSPYLLQLYADAAWRAAEPRAGATVTPDQVDAGVQDAERALWDGQYRGRWNRATPAEKDLLAAIALSLGDEGFARTADISAQLGKSASQLSQSRADLIDKGLVEAVGHGQLAFTVPGFERFVRAVTGPDAPEPRPGRHRSPSLDTGRGPELGS